MENDPKTGNNIYADEYAFKHDATIFGWGAHIDGCGGLPNADRTEIEQALDAHIQAMIAQYPTSTHYRLLASSYAPSQKLLLRCNGVRNAHGK